MEPLAPGKIGSLPRDELWEGEAERGRYNSFESFVTVLLPFSPWGGTSQRQ
jgi:hypothetical protein